MKITLDQFCEQWCPKGNIKLKMNQFQYNIEEFTTRVGDYTRRTFQASFFNQGFYKGKQWQCKKSKWSEKFPHPILLDTSTLLRSIKGDGKGINRVGFRHDGSKIYRKGAKYIIQTSEISSPDKGKRGKNSHAKGYAAIHNTDPSLHEFTVNQYSKKKPTQRPFIGFSTQTDEYIENNFISLIFKGFPC